MASSELPLLEVANLTKVFSTGGVFRKGVLKAVDDVNFNLSAEEPKIACLAGESGSGKTTIARIVLDLIKPTFGEIKYKGKDIHKMNRGEYGTYRREVQAVFQDPFGAYNPFYRVSHILKVPIKKFNLASSQGDSTKKIDEAFRMVGLTSEEVLEKYPHELSGGQRQRVMLARIFLMRPTIIVADEPVSMIDTSLRAEILNIILDFKKRYGVSLLYITHDLAVANYLCEEIMILYLGEIVEKGRTDVVIKTPRHPYTQLLISAIPIPNPKSRWTKETKLDAADTEYITSYGLAKYPGCKFYDRCPHAMDICKGTSPQVIDVGSGHQVACHLYSEKEK